LEEAIAMDATQTAGGPSPPLPIPDNFPVTWESPTDEMAFWHIDPIHFPTTVTPAMEIFGDAFTKGVDRSFAAYEMPIRLQYRRINTYFYTGNSLPVPPDQLEAQGAKAEARLKEGVAAFPDRWENEWLPEVKEHLAFWDEFDLDGASPDALAEHFDQTRVRLARLWDIHFLLEVPAILSMSLFDEVFKDLLGEEDTLASYKLLQGQGNKTVDGGHGLWSLSKKALESEELRSAITDNPSEGVLPALSATAEGSEFADEFRRYLAEWGQRTDVFCELGSPSWEEDPSTPLTNLKDFMAQPDRDPAAELSLLAVERETSVADARERLAGYPEEARNQFEFLLARAQSGTKLHEDHNYWIDQMSSNKVRQMVLGVGRRLAAAGSVDSANDVAYLTPNEIREAALSNGTGDRRTTVTERKAEMEHFGAIQPPPIGTPPPEGEPTDPMGIAMMKFFGARPKTSDSADVVSGNAGSPGKVTGTARIIRTLADADRLGQGDILVTTTTMPAWTPLFGTAAAVVTDAGGVLSHCAIVAREYGIPAVVGTGNGTTVVKDGQAVEVDGSAGEVRILA
jgi:phosphohistidine swiveling domain-containing protein